MAKEKPSKKPRSEQIETVNIFFENNALLPILYGERDHHLQHLEKLLNITAVARGNMLSITGKRRDIEATESILNGLYARIEKGDSDITLAEVDAAVRMEPPVPDKKRDKADKADEEEGGSEVTIKTMRKAITPYSHVQANYMRALFDSELVFALGPAGTGKTYIAVAMAVYMLLNRRVERIILSRPAVEAGEKIGFLPGDIKDKIDPFMRPLYDALFDMMPAERVQQCLDADEIELAPLAFMRGRTLSNAFVILDEAQNTTPTQMKMFLTRMGQNSRMVITGDLSQVDLPKDIKSGLRDCIPIVEPIEEISVVRFSDNDVVRHRLASRVVKAYDAWEEQKKQRMAQQNAT